MEYNGKIFPIDFVWTKIDLFAIYKQLMKEFEIPPDTIISGFIIDPELGGPICRFRLFEGLRGDQFEQKPLPTEASIPRLRAYFDR